MQPRLFEFLPFTIALASSATSAVAQTDGVISGSVTADADGSVGSGAVVELQSGALVTPLQATTGADGHFAFPRLVSGDYVLTVTHLSFQEKRYRLSLKPREVQNVDVAMVLRPVQEAVDVTAEPIPSVFSPGSTHLGAERLAQLPLAQQTNLPDAIVTAAPGMIRGHDDFVHIRGHEVALNPSINGVQFWENAVLSWTRRRLHRIPQRDDRGVSRGVWQPLWRHPGRRDQIRLHV